MANPVSTGMRCRCSFVSLFFSFYEQRLGVRQYEKLEDPDTVLTRSTVLGSNVTYEIRVRCVHAHCAYT